MPDNTTTIRIYRTDRPAMEGFPGTAADVIHKLLNPCTHPAESRQRMGGAVVHHPGTQLTMPASIYLCGACNQMIVLPGEPVDQTEA